MRATFEAARRRYPGRRLWAVYEPLTFHRTAAMLDAFAEVLAEADRAAVIDIWAVRDPDRTITSAAALADAVTARGGVPAVAIGSPEAAAAWLADAGRAGRRRPGDGRRPVVRGAAEQLRRRACARARPLVATRRRRAAIRRVWPAARARVRRRLVPPRARRRSVRPRRRSAGRRAGGRPR